MKKTHLLSLALACMLSVSQTVYGQKVSREEWRKQIDAQEATINDYVAKKLNGSKHAGLLKQFYASMEHGDKLKPADLSRMSENYLKDYYRAKYFEENPAVKSTYNPGRVQMSPAAVAPGGRVTNVACFNGNFEDDPTLFDYTGYRGPLYTGNECTFVPTSAVAYAPISVFTNPDEFQVTNNLADPLVPALNQTNNGSAHALRINGPGPCTPNRGINMLQRSFTTPTPGLYQINFSYALVMENPKNHPNAQPFFVARVLNGAGVEVGSRICRISDLTNPIYNTSGYAPNPTGCGTTDSLVWRDWTCAFIQFQGDPSQTFTVEFFAADCAAGAHFGYAYVDDICASECCPKFFMRDCCDMHGGTSTHPLGRSAENTANNSIVEKILSDYNQHMAEKYHFAAARSAAQPDPCCNPCAYPNDPYPVFIMDEFNSLISSTDYVISWSHDPGNSSAYAFILPNQQTVITVKGPGNCIWTDTLKMNCCNDTIKITPFCTWNPCDHPTSPFAVRVLDQNGNTLTTGAGYTFFWQYGSGTSTGDAITATLADFPVIVTVSDSTCTYTDTLDMNCCKANTPVDLKCTQLTSGSQLSWTAVPGATYKLILTTYDPSCCRQGVGASYVFNIAATSTVIPSSFADCFSWQVVSVCADGSESPPSAKMCSCSPPSCVAKVPDNLKCNQLSNGSMLSWNPVPGATYKLILTTYDPACCRQGVGASYVFNIAATSTVIPTTFADCFSWQVVSICPDGTQSAPSTKMCSCSPPSCTANTPENLKCTQVTTGSQISWDPVPGATYKIVINVNDPACCPQGAPPTTIVWTTASTGTIVPTSVAGCFSWYVIAICADGTQSTPSGKKCSCSPIVSSCTAKTPVDLKCNQVSSGSQLSWTAVPGATYKLIITTYDPACCHTNQIGASYVFNIAATTTVIPTSFADCFSWQVISVCPDGSTSPASAKMCSCSPVVQCAPKTPINLKCNPALSGSQISWDPVPGATYKVIITTNDPACCHTGQAGISIVWNVATTSTVVPTSLAGCFSWYVVAICPDGSSSPASVKMCSCSPVVVAQCDDPYKLKCAIIQNQTQLAWAGGALATGYELEITYNDPACCRSPFLSYTTTYPLSTTSFWLAPSTSWTCFSWRVRAVCPGGYSNWVYGGCNCTDASNPSLPTSRQSNSDGQSAGSGLGTQISVEAVPNPASEYVDFTLSGTDNLQNQSLEISIHDITGREVSRKAVNADGKVKFDVYALSPGLYIYKVTRNGELFYSGKIIIDKK